MEKETNPLENLRDLPRYQSLRAYFTEAGFPEDEPLDPLIPEDVFTGNYGRPEKTEEPAQVRRLRHYKGFPIGFMFTVENGVPDFKRLDRGSLFACAIHGLCGICGYKLDDDIASIGGPLTCQNRLNSDPPFHRECALYSLGICPFLLGRQDYSKETREENKDRPGVKMAPAAMLQPVGLFMTNRGFGFGPHGPPGYQCGLFEFGEWTSAEWYHRY